MKTVMKRGLGILLALLMVVAILPSITINAKAASGVDDFVTRCYQVAFQRTPDQGGFDFWKAKITDGKLVGSTVVYEFIFSKEYEGQNRTDKEFVNDLYTMFMGRAADQQGYDYWCGQMDAGMSRKEVFAGFANSKEFYELCYNYGITSGFFTNEYEVGQVNNVNLFVERLYKTCLGRLGDQGGQKYWVEGMLKGELTGIGCAANYIKSQEYEALGLTDEQYVENLYIGFMGRTYDEGGKANWLGHLTNKTKTRDQVFEGFANSPEFQGICAGYGIECGSYTATDIAKKILKESYYYDGEDNSLQKKKEYNTRGDITKESIYAPDGGVIYSIIYEYDKNFNLIKETKDYSDVDYYSSGTCDEYTIYEYDEQNNLVRTERYYIEDNGKAYLLGSKVYEYEYDTEDGSDCVIATWNSEDNVHWKLTERESVWKYENGELKHTKTYNVSGQLLGTCSYEYYDGVYQIVKKNSEGITIYYEILDEDGKYYQKAYCDGSDGSLGKLERYYLDDEGNIECYFIDYYSTTSLPNEYVTVRNVYY